MKKKIWKDLIFTDKTELSAIQKSLNIPKSITTAISDNEELSYLRSYNNSVQYIVLNIPVYDDSIEKTPFITYHVLPIVLIMKKESIMFLHNSKIDITKFCQTINSTSPKEIFSAFVLFLLKQYEQTMRIWQNNLHIIEPLLLKTPSNKHIEAAHTLHKSTILYQPAIIGIETVIQTIIDNKLELIWNDNLKEYYFDMMIECKQIEKMVIVNSEIITSLVNTSSSVLSNNLSQTMQTLTVITIIISIPTLITGFYGMNINLPFQNSPNALMIVTVITLIITILTSIYLYLKKLF
jgi:Mg2+ and Co2+ transporters